MRKFTDNQGRAWEVAIDVPTVRRVKDAFDGAVDLLSIVEEQSKLLERLANDEELIYDVLYAVCADQCEAAGVSDEDFGRGLVGRALLEGSDALIAEIIDFFPPPKSEILRTLWEKTKRKQDKLWQYGSAKLNSPEVEQILDNEVTRLERRMDKSLATMLSQSESESASAPPASAGA